MAFYGHSANYIIKISMKNMNKLILNILAVTHTIIYYTYTGYQQKLLDFLNFFFLGGGGHMLWTPYCSRIINLQINARLLQEKRGIYCFKPVI